MPSIEQIADSPLSAAQKASPFSLLPPHPRTLLPKLPGALLKPVTHIPFGLQTLVLKKVLKTAFNTPLSEGEMTFLKHKWLKIEISDVNISWFFSCSAQDDILIQKQNTYDVCIRGNLKSFLLLAAQKEDPDTLFFQRDLVIEGDTDLGLAIKNLIDGLDLATLPPELLFALRASAEYVHLF
jgi:predicted lipid carrier protein YhbT